MFFKTMLTVILLPAVLLGLASLGSALFTAKNVLVVFAVLAVLVLYNVYHQTHP